MMAFCITYFINDYGMSLSSMSTRRRLHCHRLIWMTAADKSPKRKTERGKGDNKRERESLKADNKVSSTHNLTHSCISRSTLSYKEQSEAEM